MTRYVAIDVETAQSYDHIVEIAAIEVVGGAISPRSLVRRVKPRSTMNPFCYAVHRISLEELASEPHFEQVAPELVEFVGSAPILAHNYAYEFNTLKREFERTAHPVYPRERFVCTMALAKKVGLPAKLRQACIQIGIQMDHLRQEHDAMSDALMAAQLFLRLHRA